MKYLKTTVNPNCHCMCVLINDQSKRFLFYYPICMVLVLKTIRTRLIRRDRTVGDFSSGQVFIIASIGLASVTTVVFNRKITNITYRILILWSRICQRINSSKVKVYFIPLIPHVIQPYVTISMLRIKLRF